MPKSKSQLLFLQEPATLPELDEWVLARMQNKDRFTFQEEDVLGSLWQQGQEIRLREDCRFQPVKFSTTHWYLTQQTLVNEQLYTVLLDETWDGTDLVGYLNQLDQNEPGAKQHVFCQDDARFRLVQSNKLFTLSLKEDSYYQDLTSEQKQRLEELMPLLLAKGQLYTTSQILAELSKIYPMDSIVLPSLEAWLITQPDWVRVGLDQWLPREQVPQVSPSRRYAVKAVVGNTLTFEPVNIVDSPEVVEPKATNLASDLDTEVEIAKELPSQVTWKIILRTWHLNEGIISVPVAARDLYPRARKLGSVAVIPALWFEDNSNLVIWLDKTRHKLFGPDLQEKLDYLGAGVILQVHWSQVGLTLTQIGESSLVAEEETRLIDLDSLNQVHFDRLESYRSTLRQILLNGPQLLNDLYEQLCTHQHHRANRNTIRSILSSSPEFNFDQSLKQWKLNPNFSEQIGAKILRRTLLINQASNNVSDANNSRKLSTVISVNKQKLAELREKLLKKSF